MNKGLRLKLARFALIFPDVRCVALMNKWLRLKKETILDNEKLLKILINGNVLTLSNKDRLEIYRMCLDYCSKKNDNLGITIFSDYISGLKSKDISKKVGMNAKELSDHKKNIYSNIAGYLYNDINKAINTNNKYSTPKDTKVFITNKFLLHNMIDERSYNLYCQKISKEKAIEVLSNNEFKSHINSDVLCRFYERYLGIDNISLGARYAKYMPGDTIIHVAYSGPSITDHDYDLPPNGKLTITYIELDTADDEEEINDPTY